ncbi:futalosine hydrolase [Streptomyces lavendulocolor]|uniref:futalosine hydrolase n=1 Tax=Streptomyces lavendulocolor TaxID=67316 RepID=UPI003C2F07EC
MRVLVVTAVAAESDSVAAGLGGCAASAPRVLPSGHVLTRLHHPSPAVPADRDGGSGPSGSPGAPGVAGRDLPGDGAPGGRPAPEGAARVVVDVVAGGVGPAAAAVATAVALATAPSAYDLVVSAGIAGGFAPHAPLGSVVVADAIVAADLGADTPGGYVAVEELGFGRSVHLPPPALTARISGALHAGGVRHVVAPVLTLSTVTGSAARTAELTARHPRAAAEAMEGFGVAEAAAAHGVPVVEIRTVSNTVGPRDRAAWRIGEALVSLRETFRLLGSTVFLEDL